MLSCVVRAGQDMSCQGCQIWLNLEALRNPGTVLNAQGNSDLIALP